MLIGLLLSDGHLVIIKKSSPTSFVRLSVSLGLKHLLYSQYLYELFEPYTNTALVTIDVLNKKTNTTHQVCKFKTVSLPQLLYYHELFYSLKGSLALALPDQPNKLIKKVPENICDIMSPVILAHLIMGVPKEEKLDNIIRIYTNSFTKNEV